MAVLPRAGQHRTDARPGGAAGNTSRKSCPPERPRPTSFRSWLPRSICSASDCAARNSKSRTCAAISTTCCRIWKTRSSSSIANSAWYSPPAPWRSFSGTTAPILPGSSLSERVSALHHAGTSGGASLADRPCHPKPARSAGRARRSADGPAVVLLSRGHSGKPPGRTGRAQRNPGPPARSRSAAQDQSRTADGGPAVGHQPHLQRRGARGEESAERHPAARGSGALQAFPRRHRCGRADGDHLPRDPAAGPRGAHVPRFHAPGGTAAGQRADAGTGSGDRGSGAPAGSRRQHPGDRPRRRPTAWKCGWIATCSSRRCSTWW